jgi:outer membrane receptor for ferrienterochelin and colicins
MFKKPIYIAMFLLVMAENLFSDVGNFVSGTVTDRNNEPLVGANIILKGTFLGSTTDMNGFYKIDDIDPGKYTIFVSYIGYRSEEMELYISEFQSEDNTDESESSFSSKLGIDEEFDADESTSDILKAPFHENLNFTLRVDALETDQIVVSASKKKEKIIDAPITIAAVSNQNIRRNISSDIGSVLKTVRGVEVYQAGLGRTAINVRGFMSAFNGRFVSLVDGANYMEPTFFIGYGNSYPFISEDIERAEVVFGPSSALYGPNAHNGLLNIITKHIRDSNGGMIAFTTGSSNLAAQRFRFAKTIGNYGFKVSGEVSSNYDWNYPRNFGQDYDMNGIITSQSEHEEAILWDESGNTPTAWNDINQDGVWNHSEQMLVMNTKFERQMVRRRSSMAFYYEPSKGPELSGGAEYYFNHSYLPFDAGLNFIDYSTSSAWFKVTAEKYYARIHYLNTEGEKYWNSDAAYYTMLRDGSDIYDAVSKTVKQDFLTNNVLRGDTQFNHSLSSTSDIIAGVDFSLYRPESNRLFLDDKGPDSRPFWWAKPDSIIGENIEINEVGAYIQYSSELPYDLKLVTAGRIDKHTYFDYNFSPRLAVQWNGLQGGNIRFTMNRAFQTPSIFNLHLLQYYNANQSNAFIPLYYDRISMDWKVINFFDPEYADKVRAGLIDLNTVYWSPLNTVFMGNKDGFKINETIEIPPLRPEVVDSYEIGLKKLVNSRTFIDLSAFYSTYKNFITPLRMVHSFYPNDDPFQSQWVTHQGADHIDNYLDKIQAVYSYTSTGLTTVYGFDLLTKYAFDDYELSASVSYYGNVSFEDEHDNEMPSLAEWEQQNFDNDTLNYFLNNLVKAISPKENSLSFNAPSTKGFLSFGKNNLFLYNLFAKINLTYTSKFDFISGYHVNTDDVNIISLSPNQFYNNPGSIGGNILIDLSISYSFNNYVFRLALNNLTDQDGPRLVSTPPLRRNFQTEFVYEF